MILQKNIQTTTKISLKSEPNLFTKKMRKNCSKIPNVNKKFHSLTEFFFLPQFLAL